MYDLLSVKDNSGQMHLSVRTTWAKTAAPRWYAALRCIWPLFVFTETGSSAAHMRGVQNSKNGHKNQDAQFLIRERSSEV